MATHFQGRFEVEFKYRLTDSAAFVHTLTALSPEVMVADNHEQDCYFDTADGALARAEKSLIIRTMAATNIVIIEILGISSLCAFRKSIIGSTSSVSS